MAAARAIQPFGCGRNEVKVDKPHTAQSDKHQRYSQIYRSMQPAHEVKFG
jgi:hypothetical protein